MNPVRQNGTSDVAQTFITSIIKQVNQSFICV